MTIRKQMRLENYDYSQSGAYFITICTIEATPLFGSIETSKMQLNPVGEMVNQILQEIPEYYPGIILDANQLMPDHLHAILCLVGSYKNGVIVNPATSLPQLVQKLKSLSARRYGEYRKQNLSLGLPEKLWQRGYYDRIIRSDSDLEEKREYIQTNPLRWELKDKSG